MVSDVFLYLLDGVLCDETWSWGTAGFLQWFYLDTLIKELSMKST